MSASDIRQARPLSAVSLAQPRACERSDIMEFDLEDNPVGDDSRPSYAERYIHAVIYAARPDIRSVAPGHRKPIHSQSQTHHHRT